MKKLLLPLAVIGSLMLSACGSESGSDSSSSSNGSPQTPSGPAGPSSRSDSAQFLMRTTFGPTDQEIDDLLTMEYETWIDNQFNTTPTYQLPLLDSLLVQYGYENINNFQFAGPRRRLRSDAWFSTAVSGQDQLRQRVAFALSQIFVISELDSTVSDRVRGVASYNDVLIEHAFGNFRNLLEDVTLHPMMGNFLSMRRNEKANDSGTIQPDENYAREIMQLFTIGLNELNIDGTERRDGNGNLIPTYGQAEVKGFAKVFTGWNYGDAPRLRSNQRTLQSEVIPMVAFADFHDTGEKALLNGVVLSANLSPEENLRRALDNLFQHSNVGPFISKQLIQRLVTSNPSPSYVARVAQVFNNNGQGVRGDLGAVVKAILLDSEALLGHESDPEGFGKLKEPVLKLTHLWRVFEAEGINGNLRYTNGLADMGQQQLSSPSVFNFFLPSFRQPGVIDDLGMVSPEFQVFNESTAVLTQNRLRLYIYNLNQGSSTNGALNTINLNYDDELALADNPAALVDHLNDVLFAGAMSSAMRNSLTEFVEQTPLNDDGTLRVTEAIFMAVLSPEFSFQR